MVEINYVKMKRYASIMPLISDMHVLQEVMISNSAGLNPGENNENILWHMGHEVKELAESLAEPHKQREKVAGEIPDVFVFLATFTGIFGHSFPDVVLSRISASFSENRVLNFTTFLQVQTYLDICSFSRNSRQNLQIMENLVTGYNRLGRVAHSFNNAHMFDLVYYMAYDLFELACNYGIDTTEATAKKIHRNGWKYPREPIRIAIEDRMANHSTEMGYYARRNEIANDVRGEYKQAWNAHGATRLDSLFEINKRYP